MRKVIPITTTIILLAIIAIASIIVYAYTRYTSSFNQDFPPPTSHFVLSTDQIVLPDNLDATQYWYWNTQNYTLNLTILNDGNSRFAPLLTFDSNDTSNWEITTVPTPLTTIANVIYIYSPLEIGAYTNIMLTVKPLDNAQNTLHLNITVSTSY